MSQLKLVLTYIAWWTEARACKQLAQGCYVVAHRPGGEPATFRSRSRRPTIEPPRHVKKYVLFFAFLPILPQLKNFSRNLSACIILILDAIFLPNLTFLGLLGPEISLGEKTVSCPHRHPAHFAFCEHVSAVHRGESVYDSHANMSHFFRRWQIPAEVDWLSGLRSAKNKNQIWRTRLLLL